jgi:hypothetical protein
METRAIPPPPILMKEAGGCLIGRLGIISQERLRASLSKSRACVLLTLKLKAETVFLLITKRLM